MIEKVSKIIGWEANLADIGYSAHVFENIGLKFSFSGYNDKITNFIKVFFETMMNLCNNGVPNEEAYIIQNEIEK